MGKVDKGNRKLHLSKNSAVFLLLGLLITLVSSGYFKIDTSTCVQAYLVFAGGILGKDISFNWGNAKEHEFAAQAIKADIKPTP